MSDRAESKPKPNTCIDCPEFHRFKEDENYGYCPMAEGVVRVDDPCCDDGKYFILESER